MKALILTVPLVTLMTLVAGCDTALEGSYKPYVPDSPAAVLWPAPDAADAQPASDRESPTTAPSTTPADTAN